MKTKLLSFFVILLCTGSLMSQRVPFELWGRGLIAGGDPEDFEVTMRELVNISIYEYPGASPMGQIKKGKNLWDLYFKVWESDATPIEKDDFKYINHNWGAMVWYEQDKGYVKVGLNSVLDGIWLKISDLENRGLKNESYVEFITRTQHSLFPERIGIRMNFRSEPSTNSKVLAKLVDDHFYVYPTGKSEGLWIEVMVEKMKYGYCEGEEEHEVLESWTGWIKLEDNAGPPNMWYYPKGC